MKRKLLTIFTAAMTSMLLMAGCASSDAGTETTTDSETSAETSTDTTEEETVTSNGGDKLILAVTDDPGNINPIMSDGRTDLMMCQMVFSRLYEYDSDGTMTMKLADSVEMSDDGLVMTVKLKEGINWHDGEPFTADDVVYTLNFITNNPTAGEYASTIFNGESLVATKVDDYTLTIEFPVAAPYVYDAMSNIYIAPEHIYADVAPENMDTTELNNTPVGTGAYKMVGHNLNESFEFEANEDYFDGAPSIKNFEYKVIANTSSATLALSSGDVDVYSIDPKDAASLEEAGININAYSEGRVGYLSPVFGTEKMDNIDFRKAIFTAIDKDAIVKTAYISEEYSDTADSFLPKTASYYSDDITTYSYDPELAKQYLADSGVTDTSVKLVYGSRADAKPTAIVIQQNLKDVGIDCEIEASDTYYTELLNFDEQPDFDLYIGGYIMGDDPSYYSTIYMSDQSVARYNNPEVDALFIEGSAELDEDARAETYKELQNLINEDAAILPLVENKAVAATNPRVDGLEEAEFAPIYMFNDTSKLFFNE